MTESYTVVPCPQQYNNCIRLCSFASEAADPLYVTYLLPYVGATSDASVAVTLTVKGVCSKQLSF